MHEIKNPLDALGNLAYLTLKDADNGELVRRYMELAEERLATVSRIVSQTLSMTGLTSVRRQEALHLLVESALRIHQETLDAKQIHLVKNLTEDLVAEVHAGELVQVLSNLISNSLDAMPSHGTLQIHLQEDSHGVCISISILGMAYRLQRPNKCSNRFTRPRAILGLALACTSRKKSLRGTREPYQLRAAPGRGGRERLSPFPFPSNKIELNAILNGRHPKHIDFG